MSICWKKLTSIFGKDDDKPCDGTTQPCSLSDTGSVQFVKGPGATDEDIARAKRMWADAKSRRNPDGTKPKTVQDMEDLEKSEHKTQIVVAPNKDKEKRNTTQPTDPFNSGPGDATITFDPDLKGDLGKGVTRDPESSLAHEATHAAHIVKGDRDPDGVKDEDEARGKENEHRRAKGLPDRPKVLEL